MNKTPKNKEAVQPKAGPGGAHDATEIARDGDVAAASHPEFSDKKRKAKDIVTRYRNTLRTLAK